MITFETKNSKNLRRKEQNREIVRKLKYRRKSCPWNLNHIDIHSVTEFVYFSFSVIPYTSYRVNLNVFLIIDVTSPAHTHTKHFSTQFSIFTNCMHRMCKNIVIYNDTFHRFTWERFFFLKKNAFLLHPAYPAANVAKYLRMSFRVSWKSRSFIQIKPLRMKYALYPYATKPRRKKHTHTKHKIELNDDLIIISISSTSLFISFSLLKRI